MDVTAKLEHEEEMHKMKTPPPKPQLSFEENKPQCDEEIEQEIFSQLLSLFEKVCH